MIFMTALWAASLANTCDAGASVSCTAAATGVAFGLYDPLATTGNTSTGNLTVSCTSQGNGMPNVTVNVTMTPGLSNSYGTRMMYSGKNSLNYNIYWDAVHSQIIGDGTGGSVVGSMKPFNVPGGGGNYVTGTLYGLVPAGQDVAPGSYADSIIVTVNY